MHPRKRVLLYCSDRYRAGILRFTIEDQCPVRVTKVYDVKSLALRAACQPYAAAVLVGSRAKRGRLPPSLPVVRVTGPQNAGNGELQEAIRLAIVGKRGPKQENRIGLYFEVA